MRRLFIRIPTVLPVLVAVLLGTAPAAVAQGAPKAKVKAITFQIDRQIEVPMVATAQAEEAKGQANVEPKGTGVMEVEGNFKNLKSPTTFGPEYLVYVVWAVTPDGRAINLGPIRLAVVPAGKGEMRATTRLQAFAIAVTAEPYFAVTRPSDTVVLVNGIPDKKYIQSQPVDLETELLQRARYKDAGLKPVTMEPGVPSELYQARNAVQIARWLKADQYAGESLDKAVKALDKAEAAQKEKRPDPDVVAMAAREAVQAAEDARAVSAKREEEARLAAERKASEEREAAAQREKAKAEAERKASDARAAASAAETESIKSEVAQRRATLLEQLNKVLATKDTDRGLVASMAGVNFATGKSELTGAARETLSRFAGIVALLPKLVFQIEGYTDDVGSEAMNQTLSEKRAQSVRDYLVTQGIAESAITSKGMGESMPVAPNDSAENRQKNRRVEIVVGGEAIGVKLQ